MGLTRKQISTVAVLLIGTFVVVLNQTLLSPALASIMRDLSNGATSPYLSFKCGGQRSLPVR